MQKAHIGDNFSKNFSNSTAFQEMWRNFLSKVIIIKTIIKTGNQVDDSSFRSRFLICSDNYDYYCLDEIVLVVLLTIELLVL